MFITISIKGLLSIFTFHACVEHTSKKFSPKFANPYLLNQV